MFLNFNVCLLSLRVLTIAQVSTSSCRNQSFDYNFFLCENSGEFCLFTHYFELLDVHLSLCVIKKQSELYMISRMYFCMFKESLYSYRVN